MAETESRKNGVKVMPCRSKKSDNFLDIYRFRLWESDVIEYFKAADKIRLDMCSRLTDENLGIYEGIWQQYGIKFSE